MKSGKVAKLIKAIDRDQVKARRKERKEKRKIK